MSLVSLILSPLIRCADDSIKDLTFGHYSFKTRMADDHCLRLELSLQLLLESSKAVEISDARVVVAVHKHS